VVDLLKELSAKHSVSEEILEGAFELDKAYIPTRYPNAHPSGSPRSRYTKEEAQRLIAHAERIVKFCSDILSKI
jgi:HEPN domain-containing protein